MAEPSIVTRDGRRVTIRQADPGDAAALVRIVDAVAREGRWLLRSSFSLSVNAEAEYIANLDPEKGAYLVALAGDELVGWLVLNRGSTEYARHTAEISMGVLRSFRGVGIGTALLDSAIVWARQSGVEKLCLGVRAMNHRARLLYARMGFIEEGCRRRHVKTHEGHEDIILMALFL